MNFSAILSALLTNGTLALIIALLVILLVFGFRGLLAKLAIRLFFARLRRRNTTRYRLIKAALTKPLSYMILAGVTSFALDFMSIPEKYLGMAVNLAVSLFLAAAIWLLYAAAGLAAATILDTSHAQDTKVNPTAAHFISSAIQITIVIIGILIILSRWISDITSLIAGFGIGGLAIALAAQDTASNLFGSISIMLDKPFETGDWIETDGVAGVVERVGLRSSRIRAQDQSIVTIPNARLANSNIANATKRGSRRIAFKFGILYSTPADQIDQLIGRIKAILLDDPDVQDEGSLVCFEGFSASALEIFVCYYTLADYSAMMLVKERINFAILLAAGEIGISNAFPAINLYQGH